MGNNIPKMVHGANKAQFITPTEKGDLWSQFQNNNPRIGDVGEESEKFLERAKKYQDFKNVDFNKLAKLQGEYVASDPRAGQFGNLDNTNLNRMEYPYVSRHDGKSHEEVTEEVNDKTQITVDKIMSAFKDHGWTLNNTSTAVGNKPITQKDYKGQMKM